MADCEIITVFSMVFVREKEVEHEVYKDFGP